MFKVLAIITIFFLTPCLTTFELKLNIRLLNKIIEDILSIVYGVEIFEKTACSSVKDHHIKIYLSTSWTPEKEYILTPSNLDNLTHFNISLETKFLTHGWLSGAKVDWLINMRDAYLENGQYNVLTLGWEEYAVGRYSYSKCFLNKVAERVGHFLYDLKQITSLNLNEIHLIGHSLGAHLFALASQTTFRLTGGQKIGRITGLDPAGPMFCQPHLQKADKRLSEDDALYVDIIHTNGGEFGCRQTIGHADFFPNCGTKQPGCSEFSIRLIDIANTFNRFFDSIMCSHGRSHQMWIESIINNGFIAQRCNHCSLFEMGLCDTSYITFMGDVLSEDAIGKFYLSTSDKSPYSTRNNPQTNKFTSFNFDTGQK
ncbi:pancreatic triacylglycerol lipase-like isoform X1 [Agrilus planipennis]|uniref:Pancreatic triacylglycerol lipase-like isoform X1 n=1 Tax=Agrilus planipennis TaxID=224129 RepID=A0A7F5RA73_AGRPL|nr:pancreatic triacylglycerol lipase-like isoform X1 [Agrilus planipennis]